MIRDQELLRLVRAVIHNQILEAIPTTVQEVTKAEKELEENPVELPKSLKDPYEVLERHESNRKTD